MKVYSRQQPASKIGFKIVGIRAGMMAYYASLAIAGYALLTSKKLPILTLNSRMAKINEIPLMTVVREAAASVEYHKS